MNHRCLLVEDDFSVARALRMLLDEAKIDWIHVTNYEDAIRLLTTPDEQFCIIVCDLGIPPDREAAKPDPALGVHLIHRARALFPGKNPEYERAHWLPIIILSSAATHTFRSAMQAGATDNLSKPLGIDTLDFPETVRLWLNRANRADHATCAESHRLARVDLSRMNPAPPCPSRTDAAPVTAEVKGIVLGIPGRTYGGSSDVTVDGHTARLQHRMFTGLLRLVEGKLAGRFLTPNCDLGAPLKAGWKEASYIHSKLKPILGDRLLIENIHGTGYRLADHVTVNPEDLDVTPYVTDEGGPLASAARDIAAHIARHAAPLNAAAEEKVERKIEGKKKENRGKSR